MTRPGPAAYRTVYNRISDTPPPGPPNPMWPACLLEMNPALDAPTNRHSQADLPAPPGPPIPPTATDIRTSLHRHNLARPLASVRPACETRNPTSRVADSRPASERGTGDRGRGGCDAMGVASRSGEHAACGMEPSKTAAMATLTIQPEPETTLVAHRRVAGRWVTAISRIWGSIDPRRCSLCPRGACSYDGESGTCLVLLDGMIPLEAAPLFDASGRPFLAPPPDGPGR